MAAKLIVLDPTAEQTPEILQPAPRSEQLDGKRIAFLDNSKERASEILATLEDLFEERYRFAEVVKRRKAYYTKGASRDLIAELARSADLVITAVGG
ncbi:MAG: hypothetical protein HY347_06230 [candidate division NC10 bacterium]|nr:hypothetical protein [candidate division NC10 bacterium]